LGRYITRPAIANERLKRNTHASGLTCARAAALTGAAAGSVPSGLI